VVGVAQNGFFGFFSFRARWAFCLTASRASPNPQSRKKKTEVAGRVALAESLLISPRAVVLTGRPAPFRPLSALSGERAERERLTAGGQRLTESDLWLLTGRMHLWWGPRATLANSARFAAREESKVTAATALLREHRRLVVCSHRLSQRHVVSCASSWMVIASPYAEGEPTQQRRKPALFRRTDDA
jgi:hypothetical protein